MRDGTCVRCGYRTVRQLTRGIYDPSDSSHYGVMVNDGKMIRRPTSYETFLCTACGYWENYLSDAELLQRVANGDGGWAPPA
jgi:hypothetical protein